MKHTLEIEQDGVRFRIVADVRIEPIEGKPSAEACIVVELTRRGEMTKSEMAAVFGWSETKILGECKRLVAKGVIRVVYQSPGGRGKETTYALVAAPVS